MIRTTFFLYEHTIYFILLALITVYCLNSYEKNYENFCVSSSLVLVLQEFFLQYLVINSKVYSYSAKEKRNYSYLINQCLSF
jgi:hypothetical protein